MPEGLITGYFPDLTPIQQQQIEQLGPLYNEWNERINVISRKDIANLYERHVLHSLGIAKFIQFRAGTKVMDLGTGGGFPGIPLAILFPETHFTLADSILKKTKVVAAIAEAIGLTNVSIVNARVEELKPKVDFVVCRAVADLQVMIKWISRNILPGSANDIKNGLIALKGGNIAEEAGPVRLPKTIIPLSDYFEEPFFAEKYLIHVEIGGKSK